MQLWRMILNLLLLTSTCVCSLERVTHNPENNVICPQALLNCRLRNTHPLHARDVDCGPAYVCSLTIERKLCCFKKDCKPCLWSNIQLSIIPDPEDEEVKDSEASDYEQYEESSGEWDSGCVSTPNDTSEYQKNEHTPCEDQLNQIAISICYKSPERQQERCRRLDFAFTSAASHKVLNLMQVEYEDVDFGRTMKIIVGSVTAEAEIPTLKTVCSLSHLKDIKQCKGPRVHTEPLEGVVKVLLTNETERASELLYTCMKRGREGKCWHLPNNSIPQDSVTDCTCFQAWKKDSDRTELCPFVNCKTEFTTSVLRNTSVSVAHMKTNDDEPMLSWNLTVPCRIKADLWPCQLTADGKCTEVKGFRQQCCNNWAENSTKLWASGSFVNITAGNHQHLCVMLQVDGKIARYCQHPLERQFWSLLVLLPLILVCLTIVGVFLLVNKLRWYLSEWDRRSHTQDTRGQVLLLHSSSTDPQLVCKLGQVLSELGFRVFLDLWSQAEVGSRGPAAWLHSKFDHIHKHRGKALLLLSPSTLQRAEWYWKVAVEGQSNPATYCSDTLASALGCIFAERQKGVVQRFVLVQLDSHDLLINEEQDMPKLFRGLPLYKLPTQAQGLLMELCLENPNNVSGKLKKMWWMKRAQSKLAQGVQNISKKMRVRTESMLTQVDSLSLDMEDTEEKVFLRNDQC